MVRQLGKSKVEGCFEQGLLKRIKPNMKYAEQSIRQAEHFLSEAEELIEKEIKDMAFIALYNAAFHAARALLFKDGIKERSHYCIARYLEEKYVNKKLINIKFLNGFETVMSLRHNVQYSTEKVTIEEDLIELTNICEEFLTAVKKSIK